MMLFGQLLFGKCFSKWLLVYFWRENLPPLEEFHLDLHGSGNFLFLLIDLNRVCIKIIKLAPNVPNSYLLIFIPKFILFVLTTNAIIIFIMSLYMYLLKSLEFIVVYVCIEMECIYSHFISTIFIGFVFITDFLYLFIFIELDLIFFYSIYVL